MGRADPIQVPKHELPQALQFFRDYCTNLVRLRPEEFRLGDSDTLQCDLIWSDLTDTDQQELDTFLGGQSGAPDSIQTLIDQGDIYASERGVSLFIEILGTDEVFFFWQQSLLWPRLSRPLVDFESLVWRLNMQEPVEGVCNPKTKWEQIGGNFFLNSYRLCQASTALRVNFSMSESGLLLTREEEILDGDSSCSNSQ